MANGNYIPFGSRSDPDKTTLPSYLSPSTKTSGFGSPEGVMPGVPGATYVDLSTKSLYLKMEGTGPEGWKQVGLDAFFGSFITGTATAVDAILSGVGSPGALDPGVATAVYFDVTNGVQYDWYGGAWH